ncbi:hypothetical protein [Micrococcus terreus]|uniref:hypothetical protein n=1 Tax=Micrococcus terreus TaxID=574650 RepID=UPI0030178C96
MKLDASKVTRRRLAAVGLATAALLGATGCSAINPQATTIDYAPSDGIVETVGDAEVLNLLLVSGERDAEGRYIGSVANSSEEPIEVSLTVNGTTTRVSVPGGEVLSLETSENEHVIPSTGTFPGGMAQGTIEVDGQSQDVQIPVLDGTLPEYREFVPGGVDDSVTEHLYLNESEDEGGH